MKAYPTPFSVKFRSYGVLVEVRSNEQEIVDKAFDVAKRSLLEKIKVLKRGEPNVVFELTRSPKGTLRMIQNGLRLASNRPGKRSEFKFYKFFDAVLRVSVAEHAPDVVFMHAGVVGWKGKAIVLPADSFDGKSTLVAELVRQGATYYSDDFAIFDKEGNVHPFARPLSMRTDERKMKLYDLTPADLGGKAGTGPIPVGAVVFTKYRREAKWRPKDLTPGEGLMAMIPFALPMRNAPELSLLVLNILARRAILISSPRGEANIFAQNLLNCVDKSVS